MSFIDDILDELGLGGGSLQHIQAMARTVQPSDIEAMAPVFEHGSQVFNTGHGHLESAIDSVVTGWKGDAARAASDRVLSGAMTSRQAAENSSQAADQVRSYAAQLRESRQQILAVQPVDTSFGHAVQATGGPVAAALNPGAVAANMAAAQIKSEQHREQAANYLSQMNSQSEDFAASQNQVFQPLPPAPKGGIDNLPGTIQPQMPAASRGDVPPPGLGSHSGGGPAPWSPPGPTGPGHVTPIKSPTGTSGPGNAGNPGNGGPGTTSPIETTSPPPGSVTTIQGANPPGGGTGSGAPPVALPGPISGGGSGLGAGTVAALGGGAAAIAAGGVAGLNRGGLGGRGLAGAGGEDGALGERGLAGRGLGGGAGESGLEERGFARGSGFGSAAEETPGRFGGSSSGLGGFDPAEESPLRAGRMSAAAAGEMAAGERGTMPPMGGAGRRGSGDEELDKRPDYLVETDDVWGDGRLAAPPVLG